MRHRDRKREIPILSPLVPSLFPPSSPCGGRAGDGALALVSCHASGGEAQATALHADLQAVRGLAAGVDDAAVHVAGQVAVGALPGVAAAAADAGVLGGAGAAGGTVQHDVAEGQELAEEAGEDAVDAAI